MMVAFLPAFDFSGFLFEIASMPAPFAAFAAIVPARYYVRGCRPSSSPATSARCWCPHAAPLLAMSTVLFAAHCPQHPEQRLD